MSIRQLKTPAAALRYAPYLRCSTDDQAHGDFTTTDAQEAANRRYVAAKGGVCLPSYCDDGVSGTKTRRPAVNRLIADARAGLFDVAIITYMSRLGRGDAYTILEYLLKEAGVRVEMVKENFADDVGGYFQKAATRMMDGMYPVVVSGWVKSKQEEMVANGFYCGTRLPFGLKTIGGEGEPRRVVPDDCLPITERAYLLFVATGSIAQAQAYLREAAPGARLWHCDTVRTLLTSLLFRGTLRFGKNIKVNAFPAPLPRELTDAVDAIFCRPESGDPGRPGQRRESKRDTTPYYLRGAVYCAACNCRMTPTHATGAAGIIGYYECISQSKQGGCLGAKRVNANVLHAGTVQAITNLSADKIRRLCTDAVQHLPGPEAEAARAKHLRTEIKRLDTGLLRIARAIAGGAGGLTSLVTESRRMEQARAACAEQAAQAESAVRSASGKRPDAEKMAADLARFGEEWENLTLSGRARILALLVDRVEVVVKGYAAIVLKMGNGSDLMRGTFDFESSKAPLNASKPNVPFIATNPYPPSITLHIALPSARSIAPHLNGKVGKS